MTLSFEPIYPKPKKTDEIYKEFRNLLSRTRRKLRKEYGKVTATWKNKPDFVVMTSMVPYPAVIVLTNDPIFNMLNAGIPAHVIVPKSKKPGAVLSFPWDGYKSYGAKTKPKWIGSKPAVHPVNVVQRKAVTHPGVEARGWDIEITKNFKKQWRNDCLEAMRVGLFKAGFKRV